MSGNESGVFFGGNTRSHQLMPPGGPDPSAHWGRRYERTRDGLIERFRSDGHDTEVWRFEVNSGEGGWVWWSIVRCSRCDYRTRIHRFPPWARYRGSQCVPMTDAQLTDLAEDKAHREVRTRRLGWVAILGLIAVSGMMILISEDGTHPLLPVLVIAAGAGAVYNLVMAVRQWHRP